MENYYNRKTIRLKNYDYSQEGMYFVTICTNNREEILSKIDCIDVGAGLVSAHVKLTDIGRKIEKIYLNLEKEFNNIKLHEYVIMPNHVHGIIEIKERADTRPAPTIGKIICSFKSKTAVYIIKKYNKKIWQRNYYEHIIRNEKELYKIIEYIEYNPERWNEDKYNIN